MRNDYLLNAQKIIEDPNILINFVSLRVKQLRRGSRPLVESLEKLSLEDTALREIAEGKISYDLPSPEELERARAANWRGYGSVVPTPKPKSVAATPTELLGTGK
ncbi:MAG: DNA-directed RNA polymerase subunit omega [Nibricoccus sp.]